jgi:hypothetical protein
VDTTWAKQQLTHFLQLTQLSYPPPSPGVLDLSGRKVTAASSDEIIPAAQVVEQILDRALGDWRSAKPEWMSNRWQHHREAAQRALAQLQREDEIRERLGDAAPQLDAGRLHPWVWQGARSLWQSRHYGEAVRAGGCPAWRWISVGPPRRILRPGPAAQLAPGTSCVVALTRSCTRLNHMLCPGARSHRRSVQAGHHSTVVLAGWLGDAGQVNTHSR